MFTEEQLEGVQSLLLQEWEKHTGQEGPSRPTISVYTVLQQDWAVGLSLEEAVSLMQISLVRGRWWVSLPPIPNWQKVRGYQYTDDESGPQSRGFYPAETAL